MGIKDNFKRVLLIILCLFTLDRKVMAESYQEVIDDIIKDNKIVVNSVIPKSYSEAYTFLKYSIQSNNKFKQSNYSISGLGCNPDQINSQFEGVYSLSICENKVSNGIKTCEKEHKYEVNVIFDDSKIDKSILSKINTYDAEIPKGKQYNVWNDNRYENIIFIDDMELLNYVSKINSEYNDLMDLDNIFNILRFNSEYKKLTKNVNFADSGNAAGNGYGIFSSIGSNVIYEIDGYIYGISSFRIREFILNAIYVDEKIDITNKDQVLSAVQARLNDNFSNENFNVSIGDNTNLESLIEEIQEEYLSPYGMPLDESKISNQIVNISFGGYAYPFLVIQDSSKVKNLTLGNVVTTDFLTNASIEYNSKLIPADSQIKLVQNNNNSKILKKLGLANGDTFNINLFSNTVNDYFQSTSKGNFKISIPINDNLKNKDLLAYSIDDDGNVEEYNITINDNYAIFESDHLGEYTIGYFSKSDDTNLIGDMNNNGKLDLNDVIILLKKVLGII